MEIIYDTQYVCQLENPLANEKYIIFNIKHFIYSSTTTSIYHEQCRLIYTCIFIDVLVMLISHACIFSMIPIDNTY